MSTSDKNASVALLEAKLRPETVEIYRRTFHEWATAQEGFDEKFLRGFAEAVAAEREACAKLAESFKFSIRIPVSTPFVQEHELGAPQDLPCGERVAAAIRARGEA